MNYFAKEKWLNENTIRFLKFKSIVYLILSASKCNYQILYRENYFIKQKTCSFLKSHPSFLMLRL